MKHVRRFNQFIVEGYGTNQSINWDLINTAKELALEYLDKGMSLRYIVYYKQPDTPLSQFHRLANPFEVLEGRFSHDGDTFDWNSPHYSEDEILDSKKLHYTFWFPLGNEELNASLLSQLKEIYPNENIQ